MPRGAWRDVASWLRPDAAFAGAAHIVSLRLHNHRIVTNPMEPRGVIGVYDPALEQFIAHVSSQSLHGNRDAIARVLGTKKKDDE